MNTPALLLRTSTDQDGDGTFESVFSETYSADNKLLKRATDSDADGQTDAVTNYTYSDRGDETGQFYDFDNDGDVDYSFTTDRATDDVGNLVITFTSKDEVSGIEEIYTTTYDPNGNLIEEAVGGEVTASYAYNELGQITSYLSEGELTEYSYDAAGRFSGSTLLREGSSFTPTTSFTYDKNGNLTGYVTSGSSNSFENASFSYVYNELNQLTSSSVSTSVPSASLGGGSSTSYRYNELGQVTFQSFSGSGVSLFYSYNYDEEGRFVSETSDLYRIGNTISTTSYTYDEVGRVTSKTRDNLSQNRTSEIIIYEYDNLLTGGIDSAIESEVVDINTIISQSNSFGQTSGASTSFLDSGIGVVGSLDDSSVISSVETSNQFAII